MTEQAHWTKHVRPAEALKEIFTLPAAHQPLRFWKAGPEILEKIQSAREKVFTFGQDLESLAKELGVGLMFNHSCRTFEFYLDYDETLPEGWARCGSSDGTRWVVSPDQKAQDRLEELSYKIQYTDILGVVMKAVSELAPSKDDQIDWDIAMSLPDRKINMVGDDLYLVTTKPVKREYETYTILDSIPGFTAVKASEYYAAIEAQDEKNAPIAKGRAPAP